MDDEKIVRDIAGDMLQALGYQAIGVADGAAALEAYEQARREGSPFTAVIMDLTIPGGIGGKEAIGRILALDPRAKVIVSSGYSNDPIMASFRDYGFKGVITKPYGLGPFGRTLQEVLRG
jgi:CheY-like chemotaxis protein